MTVWVNSECESVQKLILLMMTIKTKQSYLVLHSNISFFNALLLQHKAKTRNSLLLDGAEARLLEEVRPWPDQNSSYFTRNELCSVWQ